MSYDPKFDQIWEYRRGDNEFDSSSHESGSSSNGEPVLKKHKLVSSLISLDEKDDISYIPKFQQKGKLDAGAVSRFKPGEGQIRSSLKDSAFNYGMGNDSFKLNGRKNKGSAYEPAALDDIKIFMESLLDELKVARENMLTWMRDEMHKLMADDARRECTKRQDVAEVYHQNNFKSCLKAQNRNGRSLEQSAGSKRPADSNDHCKNQGDHGQHIDPISSTRTESSHEQIISVQHQNNRDSGMKAQNCNGESLERYVKGKRAADYKNFNEVLQDQLDYNQTTVPTTSTEKDKEKKWGSLLKPNFSSNHTDQIASSMYLTLPTILPLPSVENQQLDISRNYIQPRAAGNKMNMILERGNIMLNARTHNGYFSGIRREEKIGSSAQLDTRNLAGSSDQKGTLISSTGNGFPVPFHEGLASGFNVLSQANLEHPPQETTNKLGLRMNGGAIRLSGGSRSENHVVANNFSGRLNYKADGGLVAFQTLNQNEGHLFPN
ncbi:uncharacterized protein LOC131164816 [Malania oleifera]|uniref:uncharacterized protein LOC131164816 n=1 Tax=Malania oleifera TaxID=397392 RepID=UPI0025AE99EB|nr:uncharacterized protein LOC131164816 [Malania oleifera]XP_057978286.1 uncharacterized protein LOC131164816 [Malania oleifera]